MIFLTNLFFTIITTPLTILTLQHKEFVPIFVQSGQVELEDLMSKMEDDVIDLASSIRRAYERRCSEETLQNCKHGSNHVCLTERLNPSCLKPTSPNHVCGGDNEGGVNHCGVLFDYKSTSISLPKQMMRVLNDPLGGPSSEKIMETICYTRQVDSVYVSKYTQNMSFWGRYGVEPPWMYFGSNDGLFQRHPGYYQENCGGYDPRVRSWYVAGSSMSKDVILVLDILWFVSSTSNSGSDETYDLMEKSIKSFINNLSIADRVFVPTFGLSSWLLDLSHTSNITTSAMNNLKNEEESLVFDKWIRATRENKIKLANDITYLFHLDVELKKGGIGDADPPSEMSIVDTFQHVFDILSNYENQTETDDGSGCSVSVLLFVDETKETKRYPSSGGDGTVNPDVHEVALMKQNTQEKIDRPLLVALYGMENTVLTTNTTSAPFPNLSKQISCLTDGLYVPINNPTTLSRDVSLFFKVLASSYYFESNKSNDGDMSHYPTWLEPYEFFASGRKDVLIGTTIAAPVFRHPEAFGQNQEEPYLLGVVGFDFTADAMYEALGSPPDNEEDLRHSQLLETMTNSMSKSKCPKFDLNRMRCYLGSLQHHLGGGDHAICSLNCSTSMTTTKGNNTEQSSLKESQKKICVPSDILEDPDSLWSNTLNRDLPYTQRACCKFGETTPSSECTSSYSPVTNTPDNDDIVLIPEKHAGTGDAAGTGGLSTISIALIVIGIASFITLFFGAIIIFRTSKRKNEASSSRSKANDRTTTMTSLSNIQYKEEREENHVGNNYESNENDGMEGGTQQLQNPQEDDYDSSIPLSSRENQQNTGRLRGSPPLSQSGSSSLSSVSSTTLLHQRRSLNIGNISSRAGEDGSTNVTAQDIPIAMPVDGSNESSSSNNG